MSLCAISLLHCPVICLISVLFQLLVSLSLSLPLSLSHLSSLSHCFCFYIYLCLSLTLFLFLYLCFSPHLIFLFVCFLHCQINCLLSLLFHLPMSHLLSQYFYFYLVSSPTSSFSSLLSLPLCMMFMLDNTADITLCGH